MANQIKYGDYIACMYIRSPFQPLGLFSEVYTLRRCNRNIRVITDCTQSTTFPVCMSTDKPSFLTMSELVQPRVKEPANKIFGTDLNIIL